MRRRGALAIAGALCAAVAGGCGDGRRDGAGATAPATTVAAVTTAEPATTEPATTAARRYAATPIVIPDIGVREDDADDVRLERMELSATPAIAAVEAALLDQGARRSFDEGVVAEASAAFSLAAGGARLSGRSYALRLRPGRYLSTLRWRISALIAMDDPDAIVPDGPGTLIGEAPYHDGQRVAGCTIVDSAAACVLLDGNEAQLPSTRALVRRLLVALRGRLTAAAARSPSDLAQAVEPRDGDVPDDVTAGAWQIVRADDAPHATTWDTIWFVRSLGIDGISSIDSALTAGTGALYCEVIVVEFQSSEQARAYLERLADERADNGKVEPLPPPALADDAVVHRGADGTPGFVTMRRGPVVVVMNLRQWRALDPVAVATELARAIDGRLAALVPSDADIVA